MTKNQNKRQNQHTDLKGTCPLHHQKKQQQKNQQQKKQNKRG